MYVCVCVYTDLKEGKGRKVKEGDRGKKEGKMGGKKREKKEGGRLGPVFEPRISHLFDLCFSLLDHLFLV